MRKDSTLLRWAGLLFCSALFGLRPLAAKVATPKPLKEGDDLPYKAQWGPYRVTAVKAPDGSALFRISNSAGRVCREIHAPFIDLIDYPNLSGRGGAEELRVVTHPETNILGQITTYCFTRHGGLRNILVMPGEFTNLRTLNPHGRPHIIDNDLTVLELVGPLCHGCCPTVMWVLGWNGHRYVLQNRRYSAPAQRKARSYQIELSRALKKPDWTGDTVLRPAIGYWANLATIGQQAVARRWLLKKLPPKYCERFLGTLPEVRARLNRWPSRITTTQKYVIFAPE